MQLIYLAPLHWSSFAQRPHMFVRWFHEQYQCPVLWVNPYPTRFPSLRDIKRIGAALDACATEIPVWLKVITPSALPIEPVPGSPFINTFLWKKSVRELQHFAQKGKTVLAIGKPSAFAQHALKHVNHTMSFYDMMDDYPEFYSGLSKISFASKEKDIVKTVTMVAVSSHQLQKKWSPVRTDLQLVCNGLMPELFLPVSATFKKPKLVFGYVGTIAQWCDWEWLIELATAFPHACVRMIGPIYAEPPQTLPRNIEFKPACDHITAIAEMKNFDVGLIPFKRNALTASVDPIKYYEYRALGIPVVSTEFGEMVHHQKERGVFLTNKSTSIQSAVENALAFVDSTEQRQIFIAQHSWEKRFSLLMNLFNSVCF